MMNTLYKRPMMNSILNIKLLLHSTYSYFSTLSQYQYIMSLLHCHCTLFLPLLTVTCSIDSSMLAVLLVSLPLHLITHTD